MSVYAAATISGSPAAVLCSADGGEVLKKRSRDRFGYPNSGSGPLHSYVQSPTYDEPLWINGYFVWGEHPWPNQSGAIEYSFSTPCGTGIVQAYNTRWGWCQRICYADSPYYAQGEPRCLVHERNFYQEDVGMPKWVFQRLDYASAKALAPYGRPVILRRNMDGAEVTKLASFEHHESEIRSYIEIGSDLGDWELAKQVLSYSVKRAIASAYTEAMINIPKAATNSWANLLSTLDIVKSVVSTVFHPTSSYRDLAKKISRLKDDTSMVKQLENFWLQYRYVFTTTKSDVAEYSNATKALAALIADPVMHVDGEYGFDSGTYGAHLTFKTEDTLPNDLLSWLLYYGFEPSLVNAWDMIPFSFVADWFLHIGDILDWIEAYEGRFRLKPTDVWFTLKSAGRGYTSYIRFPGYIPQDVAFLDSGAVSTKTIVKRVIDGVCLFGP